MMRARAVFLALHVCSPTLVACRDAVPRPPDEVARDILEGTKLRRESALTEAISLKDGIIEPMRRISADFATMPNESSLDVARVLASNSSPRAHAVLEELSQRAELMPRLTGMAGLALRGSRLGGSVPFLVRIARGEFSSDEQRAAEVSYDGRGVVSVGTLITLRALAIVAMSGGEEASVTGTLESVMLGSDQPLHGHAARALCRGSRSDAQAVFQRVLTAGSTKARGIALQSLIALGDTEAVGVAIGRLDASSQSDDLIRALEAVTGKRFGADTNAWRSWWAEARGKYQLPRSMMCGELLEP
jgi:hypothetical protein